MESKEIIEVKENLFEDYGDAEELKYLRSREAFTVGEMWARSVKDFADCTAIGDGNTYTYAEVDGLVAAFRGALKARGVKKGDRVGIYIPNSFECVKAFLAVVTLGAVAVMLPPQLDEKAVYGSALKFSLKSLVYDGALQDKLKLVSSLPVTLISDTESGEKTEAETVSDTDPAVILFTGGTTGKNKGALLTHHALMRGAINGCYGYKGVLKERYLLVLPLTHVFGLVRDTLTPFLTGSAVYICRNPKNMFNEMVAYKPTVLILVPALAELGLNISKQLGTKIFGGSLKHIIAGACTVAPHLSKEYADIGVTLLAGYGLTETANLVSGNPHTLENPSSVGFPYQYQQLKIVDGELWIKGDHLMLEYVGEPEETAAAFEDGWFKTGDLVRFDENGYLYIVGRIKELIFLDSGEKVSPAELEEKFCVPDYINDALVYDVVEGGKKILVLEVVLRGGFTVTKEQVIEELKAINLTLPTYHRVNRISVRDEDFPRSASMKKLRPRKTL